MDYVTLDDRDFEYGDVTELLPGVQRVIAKNPSKFTYRGTGTYIVGGADVAVIDPGPTIDSHRDALAAALEGRTVRSILVTHCHADHSPLAAWLAAETSAPTFAFGPHRAATDEWDIGSLPDDFGREPEPPADAGADADASTDDAVGVDESGPGGILLERSGVWPAPDISTQIERPIIASRQCSRTGCSDAAAVTLTYDYRQSQVWIDRLAPERNPHHYDMCDRHAERLSVPRGWHLDDRRGARRNALIAV